MGYHSEEYDPSTGSYGGSGSPMSTDMPPVPEYQSQNMMPQQGGGPYQQMLQQMMMQQQMMNLQQQGGQGMPQQQGGGSPWGQLAETGMKMGMKKFGPQIASGIGNFLGIGGGAAGAGAAGASAGIGGMLSGLGGAASGAMGALAPFAAPLAIGKLGGEALDMLMPGYRKGLNKMTTKAFGGKAKNMLAPWKWRL